MPRLRLAWAFGFPRALSVRAQPTVVGDWLFTASETGDVFGLDAKTGLHALDVPGQGRRARRAERGERWARASSVCISAMGKPMRTVWMR